MENIDKRQSELVDAMRFPLIVLVVFAHSLGFVNVDISLSADGWNIYHFVSEMISHNFCRLAVCWFYVVSGYFFFYTLKDGAFSWDWVLGKWKKRIYSLLIPYVFWNLFVVAVVFAKGWLFSSAGLGSEETEVFMMESGPLYWFLTGPADFPLYFMRDLMILSLAAPLWYMAVKRFKWGSLLVLFLVYASPLAPAYPGMRAIFFFGLGAWLGIWKINMLQICRRVKGISYILTAILLLVITYYNSSPHHEWMQRAFYPFGMITFMNVCDMLVSNEKRRLALCELSKSVFFIFAAHEIYILGWTKGLFLRIFGSSLAGTWISYLFVPVVVLAVCVVLYRCLNRFMPRTLAFVSGGRTKKTK